MVKDYDGHRDNEADTATPHIVSELVIGARTLFDYMKERESIRLRKEAGSPRPWTQDPILHEFSFTNVRRIHDRTTRSLLSLFYDPHTSTASAGDILFNCALARFFGRAEVVTHLGWQTDWQPEAVIAQARSWKGCLFTSAYVITNNGQSDDRGCPELC